LIFDFSGALARWPQFAWGGVTTLWLSLVAMTLGLLIGSVASLAAGARRRALRALPQIYVEAIRNTPLLVQIYVIYFGLPAVGIRLAPTAAAVLSLGLYAGAYATEILRAGLEAIPRGQIEAARALGLSSWRTLRHVLAAQVVAAMYPALISQFVLLMLASSLVSAISVADLTATANDIQGLTFRPFEAFLLVAGCYLGLTLLLRAGLGALEHRLYRFKFVRR
jgi:polar amino acid transport system permease protein